MKKYDEVSVVRQLNNVNAVIGINPASKVIKVAKNSAIGNGTSGKIDFLSHYCGYHVEIIQQQKERDEEIAAKKAAKKAARKAKFAEDNTFKGITRAVDKRMRTIKRK